MEGTVAVVGLLAMFVLPLVLVAIILYYKDRKLKMLHRTIALLAEKGLPVPPELIPRPDAGRSGLRAGLVLVAMGLGLAIFLWERGGPWSIGLIPGLMGAALLLAWAIERRSRG